MVAGQNKRAWWAKRESRSVAEVLAIAFVAGSICVFIFFFFLSLMGIFAGLPPFLEIGRANQTNWYEVILWISSAGAGVLVFTTVFRRGAKSLPRKSEFRLGTINSSLLLFTASLVAVTAGAVTFCVSIYLSACIGLWANLIDFRLSPPYKEPSRYQSFMWIWSIGLGVVIFWIVYRQILITSHHIEPSARGDSRGAVSE